MNCIFSLFEYIHTSRSTRLVNWGKNGFTFLFCDYLPEIYILRRFSNTKPNIISC